MKIGVRERLKRMVTYPVMYGYGHGYQFSNHRFLLVLAPSTFLTVEDISYSALSVAGMSGK